MFRGNLEHTGVYASSGPAKFNQVKWKFHTGGKVVSSPAVVEGTVYVGSTDNNLYAVDQETGAQKWKFKSFGSVTSSPAVSGGVVYFGSMDGNFYAVSADKGEMKWRFPTGGERRFAAKRLHGMEPAGEMMPDPFDFYLSSPAVFDGVVYFGSGDGNIYALDVSTGAVRWRFQTGDVVHASPAIADGTVYIGSWDSYFYALDAKTGKEKWRYKTGEDRKIYNQVGIQASAAVVDGVVYFGCRDSKFYALDAKSGEKRWEYSNHGSWVITSAAVKNGKVYFATSDSTTIRALDIKTGAETFTLKLKWPMFSSPAIAGEMLYIGSHEGRLTAIDFATQKVAWDFQTDGSKQNGPAFTKPDGTPNYALAFESNFYDDIVAGGTKMLTVGAILSSPVVVKGVIYFGSTDGNLYAVN